MGQKTFIKLYPDDVRRYDIYKAAILGLIQGWCEYHRINGNKQSDGKYWSGHLSSQNIVEQTGIPLRTVKRKLKELVEDNIIQRGNFNKKSYDATAWYRRLPETEVVSQRTGGSDTETLVVVTESHQGSVREEPTIPYNPLQSSKIQIESNICALGIENLLKEINTYGAGAVRHMKNQLEKGMPKRKEELVRYEAILQLKEMKPELFN